MNRLSKGFGKFLGHGSMMDKYSMETCSLFTHMPGVPHCSSMVFTEFQGGWKRTLS